MNVAEFEALTPKAAYEGIVEYFSRPGAQLSYQMNEFGDLVCLYRGPNGQACAIGCLLPDELYRRDFEGVAAHEVVSGAVVYEVSDFLDAAQTIHDQQASEVHGGLSMEEGVQRFLKNLKSWYETEYEADSNAE